MVKIKVCGVRDEASAAEAVASGVDWIGLNFVPTSKRRVDLAAAKRLMPLLGERAVGVFSDQSAEEIERIVRALDLRVVQLHGQESRELCRAFSGLTRIKALTVSAELPGQVARYRGEVEWLLLDGARPGSGQRFDRAWLSGQALPRPFAVAGGLNPENVREVIRTLSPDAVDTASGIERDGQPDPVRLRAFVRAAREGS